MNEELFPASEGAMLSPRLAWRKKHRIQTAHADRPIDPDDSDDRWLAWIERIEGERPGPMNSVTGEIEEEALERLAVKFAIPLWNEEAK